MGLLHLSKQAGVSAQGEPLELEMNLPRLDLYQRKPLQQRERFIHQHDIHLQTFRR